MSTLAVAVARELATVAARDADHARADLPGEPHRPHEVRADVARLVSPADREHEQAVAAREARRVEPVGVRRGPSRRR